MPDSRRNPESHDRDTDRAALDELRRAFGMGEPATDLDDDATGDSTAATDGEPYHFEIVEQEPLELDATEPTPVDTDLDVDDQSDDAPAWLEASEPARSAPESQRQSEAEVPDTPAPTIIRIDDYRGAVSDEPSPADAGAAPDPDATVAADPAEPGDRRVIAIEADDLPDPVYVEGSLESGGSGSIVFIEDAPDSEMLTPESDRDLRRGIEPRMRERRIAVKRAKGRKRLIWLAVAAVVVLLGVGALAVLGSSLFAIRADEVVVTGNAYTDPERLQAVIDDLVGTPVLRADTGAAERQLETIPWVEDAEVATDFPHGLRIDIRERRAVATYQGPDTRFRVLDTDGRVLDVLDMYPIAYVLVSGPDPVDLEAGEFAPQGFKAAAELAQNLTGSVRGHVERIEVTANGSRLSMWLDDGSEVRFGEARDLFVKLVRLETVLTVNPERTPGPIDVSTGETTSPIAPAGA